MHVLKFGGTSMGDEDTWRQILGIIKNYDHPIVVVSATARTTRQLVAAAELAPKDIDESIKIAQTIRKRHRTLIKNFLEKNISGECHNVLPTCNDWIDKCTNSLIQLLETISENKSVSASQKDAIASIGEQLSAYLFACCGQTYGLPMHWVDAASIIKTDSNFGQAAPKINLIEQQSAQLSHHTKKRRIPVMGGFYGENEAGEVTTLGFEGSDYTASLIGSVLDAEAIEIWTDVSGIYTCDPRVVQQAQPIPELSFQEATELAYFGAKVLHPSTTKPAAEKNIPIFVKNIFEPHHTGTKIHRQVASNGWAKAITYLKKIVILTVTAEQSHEGHHFLAEVFKKLDEARQPVNAVTTTEASVSVALQLSDRIKHLRASLAEVGTVELAEGQGLISLIGCDFDRSETMQKYVLEGITDLQPALMSYSRSKQNLNITVPETSLIPAVQRIHHLLFEGPK